MSNIMKLVIVTLVMFIAPLLIMMYIALIAGSTFMQSQWDIAWLLMLVGLLIEFVLFLIHTSR